ncbi:hypothetical protein EAG_03584 [Camponotus floridanus]|uniref:Uncharacterized protein n=1 Tax=Camponotus floridanus TaxID=104421 RepID=E2ANY2_CAMFO|nr:hypothetical protein EAG_03584 [Camponotus floridanus]
MFIDPSTRPDYHGEVSSKTEIADRFRRMDDLFTISLPETKEVSQETFYGLSENLPVKRCTQFKVTTSVRPEGIKGQTRRQVYRQEVGFSAAFFPPILVINFQVVQRCPVELRNDVIDGAREQEGWLLRCPAGPACGRASAWHLHPVKRKLVKAQAVMCRIVPQPPWATFAVFSSGCLKDKAPGSGVTEREREDRLASLVSCGSSHDNDMWPLHFFIHVVHRFKTLLVNNGEKYGYGNNDLSL